MSPINKSYVDVPGNIVTRLPIVAREGVLHGGFLSADKSKLTQLCKRILERPTDGQFRFRAVTKYVLFTALYVERMSSGDPLDKSKGSVGEIDIGFWVLVQGRETDGRSLGLHWLPVYIFVDGASAMAGGREIFGYPKDLGFFHRPSNDLKNDMTVEVETVLFKTFGPDEKAQRDLLFAVRSAEKPALETTAADFQSEDVDLDLLLADLGKSVLDDTFGDTHANSLMSSFSLPFLKMPMIFLKQSRSPDFADLADCQSIVTVSAQTDRLRGVGWFKQRYDVVLEPSESHPIADDFGFKDVNRLYWPFRVEQDFTVGFGRTVWKA